MPNSTMVCCITRALALPLGQRCHIAACLLAVMFIAGTCSSLGRKHGAMLGANEHPYSGGVEQELCSGTPAISVALQVCASWVKYTGGVWSQGCDGAWTFGHEVPVVGYGRDAAIGKLYWLIRNFFGPQWGEEGYMRMEMGRYLASISELPQYAELDTDSPYIEWYRNQLAQQQQQA